MPRPSGVSGADILCLIINNRIRRPIRPGGDDQVNCFSAPVISVRLVDLSGGPIQMRRLTKVIPMHV